MRAPGSRIRPTAEQCDDGADDSDVRPNACRLDCRRARCRDGVIDDGEICFDPERLFAGRQRRGRLRRDGVPDAITLTPDWDWDSTMTVWLGDGFGDFRERWSADVPFGAIDLADLDDDGDLDLVLTDGAVT
jgi:hypothetical protein